MWGFRRETCTNLEDQKEATAQLRGEPWFLFDFMSVYYQYMYIFSYIIYLYEVACFFLSSEDNVAKSNQT